MRISKNLIIDHYRKSGKMPSISCVKNEEGEEVSIFDIIPSNELTIQELEQNKINKVKIRSLVNKLPKDQKEVVLMRMYYDMSFKEIAYITKVSINTSLGRMRYALINLKKEIEENELELIRY